MTNEERRRKLIEERRVDEERRLGKRRKSKLHSWVDRKMEEGKKKGEEIGDTNPLGRFLMTVGLLVVAVGFYLMFTDGASETSLVIWFFSGLLLFFFGAITNGITGFEKHAPEIIDAVGDYMSEVSTKQNIRDRYSAYTKKHRLDEGEDSIIGGLMSRTDSPRDFEIELLKMLIHYGEKHLQSELNALLGVVEAEPEPAAESEEEREWAEEENVWARAGFTRKLDSEEAVLNEYERRKNQAWSDFDDGKITRERLQYRLDRLEQIKNEMLEELRRKDAMNE